MESPPSPTWAGWGGAAESSKHVSLLAAPPAVLAHGSAQETVSNDADPT